MEDGAVAVVGVGVYLAYRLAGVNLVALADEDGGEVAVD